MKTSKFDIGAEIISILTKGMYPDPKDAVREYIQNAVDAKAKNISVKIRQNSIVVQDDGIGMDYPILRKAVRLGISDKNPKKDVGFMGIGIYSAFHLCNSLIIYSRGSEDIPNKLVMDFGGMKVFLKTQKEQRLEGTLNPDEFLDLQTLLEKFITLTEDGDFASDNFPSKGTRVEMVNLLPEFYEEVADFDRMSNYLEEVIPLPFSPEFTWGKIIEEEIKKRCDEQNRNFELVENLILQVGGRNEKLFRPYKDTDFGKGKPIEPIYYDIKKDNIFFGVAWGCLNSAREKVFVKQLRGFLLRKQGFAIGKRENLIKYFTGGNTYFDRYEGEIILVHQEVLPNASRNDLEFSSLRTLFYEELRKVAEEYETIGNEYQEYGKTDDELAKVNDLLKVQNAKFNNYKEDPNKLLEQIVEVRNLYNRVIKRKNFRPNSEAKNTAENILEQAKGLETLIQNRIFSISNHQKISKEEQKKPIQIAKELSENKEKLPPVLNKKYESLTELLDEFEIPLSEKLIKILNIIDEKYIQDKSDTRLKYYQLLEELRLEISNLE